ncbi:MAG: hypothetical protein AAF629_35840 [Chloroflexota bacterium]
MGVVDLLFSRRLVIAPKISPGSKGKTTIQENRPVVKAEQKDEPRRTQRALAFFQEFVFSSRLLQFTTTQRPLVMCYWSFFFALQIEIRAEAFFTTKKKSLNQE